MTATTLIQRAIARGDIIPAPPRRGRGRPPVLRMPDRVREVIEEWKKQRTLEQVCVDKGVSYNTVKYWLYHARKK